MSGHPNGFAREMITDSLERHRGHCRRCQTGQQCDTAEALVERLVERMLATASGPRGQA